jgi:pyruvate dehydrogenase E2 component (dihydrolipoamide acetyltransferase)
MVVESDKADMDCESYVEGYLASIVVPEGGVAAVGAPVALLATSQSDIAAVASQGPGTKVAAPAPAPLPVSVPAPAPLPSPVAASPPPAAAPAISAPALSVPYATVAMPALSSTMTEGKIVSWAKNVGERIEVGDVIMVVESDKADMDCEAYEAGWLAKVLCAEGSAAKVGNAIAVLAKNQADIPQIQAFDWGSGSPSKASAPAPSPPAPAPPVTSATPSPAPPVSPASPVAVAAPAPAKSSGRVVASGYAKKLAEELSVDISLVAGTGPEGRIVAKDIEAFKASGAGGAYISYTPTPGVLNATPGAKKLATSKNVDLSKIKGTGNFGRITTTDVELSLGIKKTETVTAPVAAAGKQKETPVESAWPSGVLKMTGMEKAVAKNMEATLNVPVFSVSRPICTDKFDELYQLLKPKGVTVTSLLTVAVARALEKHPLINAVYQAPDEIRFNPDINIANAVAIEGGLITPVIRKANTLDLYELSRQWKVLVGKAKSKSLSAEEYSTGTLTITNLGMMGVTHFTPIIPPNHGAILAVGTSIPVVKQMSNGSFGVQKEMMVTLVADHRHIYGAHAAAFLADLADLIENQTQSLTM